jgi:hypothetical protein
VVKRLTIDEDGINGIGFQQFGFDVQEDQGFSAV